MRINDSAIGFFREALPPVGPRASAGERRLDADAVSSWTERAVAHGLDADPTGLREIADLAMRHGASAVVAALACDRTEPYVARLRALGRLGAAIERGNDPSNDS